MHFHGPLEDGSKIDGDLEATTLLIISKGNDVRVLYRHLIMHFHGPLEDGSKIDGDLEATCLSKLLLLGLI